MAFEPSVKLYAPDTGERLYEKFHVAQQWGCLPDSVATMAARHRVKRYASQTGRGKPSYFYPESEVARVTAIRRGLTHDKPIVEVPYPDEVEQSDESGEA